MDIPRIWTQRDPHNRDHLRAAMDLLAELQPETMIVTKQTARELAALDIPVKSKVVDRDTIKEATLVCAFYFLERGLMFADNIISVCRTCRAPVELRSHALAINTRKLCCFCAVDEMLAEYWASNRHP